MLVRRMVVVVLAVLAVVAASAWSIRPVDAVGVQTAARWWLDFGDDAGKYVRDGECDDPRFEGPGVDLFLFHENRGRNVTDWSAAVAGGQRPSVRLLSFFQAVRPGPAAPASCRSAFRSGPGCAG